MGNNPEKTIDKFTFNDVKIEYDNPITPEDIDENPFEFQEDEDRLLSFCMFKYTYGFWDIYKNEIRNCPYFMFNWVVQSRTTLDI